MQMLHPGIHASARDPLVQGGRVQCLKNVSRMSVATPVRLVGDAARAPAFSSCKLTASSEHRSGLERLLLSPRPTSERL